MLRINVSKFISFFLILYLVHEKTPGSSWRVGPASDQHLLSHTGPALQPTHFHSPCYWKCLLPPHGLNLSLCSIWLLIVFLHTMISLKMKLNHGTLELKVISNSFLSHSGQKPTMENLRSPCDCPVPCHHLFDVLSCDHTVHSPSFCHMGLITVLPLRQVCFSLMDSSFCPSMPLPQVSSWFIP